MPPRPTLHPRLAALCLGLSCTALPAQGIVWDVPHRGALVYDRTTQGFELGAPPSRLRPQWVIEGAGPGAYTWRYHAATPETVPAGWEQPGFDDGAWPHGRGEFGPDVGRNPVQQTVWNGTWLGLRARVDLGTRKPRAVLVRASFDDVLSIHWNGTKVAERSDLGRDREIWLVGASLDAWQRGENTLAFACLNTGGYQCLDVAVATFATLPTGARTTDDLARLWREEHDRAAGVRGDLFGGYRMPPLLLEGDLQNGLHVRLPPADLRDLGWWMAMDLRCGVTGGAVAAEAARLYRLGDLVVKGRATAVDTEGWQTIELTVRNSAEPAPRSDSKRFVDRFIAPHVAYGFDGRLVVRRKLAVAGNRVRIVEFATELDGRVLRGKDWKDVAAALRQRETWRFREVREGQDAAFRASVTAAIERGTKRLRRRLENLDRDALEAESPDADRSYHTGRLAIGLLALLKGGVPKDDPVVKKGYDELRRRVLVDTYSLGNALMALEALYAPASEWGDLRSGTIDRPQRRQVPADDLKLMQQWARQLLHNVDDRVDPAYLLRFNYVRGPRTDNSVNQYGLLGLYSAHLCGVEVPASVWEAAINHLLADQCPEGEKVRLDLTDYRTHARRSAAPDEKFTVSTMYARACGWSYHGPKSDGELSPVYGSMTAAGITGLAICQAALEDYPNVKRPKLQGEASRARADGFAWLAQNMTMRYHAGAIDRQPRWFYYYLYGIERAALLSGIALIADRDWYFEGAMVLVHSQQDDGHWPAELQADLAVERDAMAILFLKQSTAPVLTGR